MSRMLIVLFTALFVAGCQSTGGTMAIKATATEGKPLTVSVEWTHD